VGTEEATGVPFGAVGASGAAGAGSVARVRATAQVQVLQVGDLARETGKTVRAIHLYEDMGLLRPVDRSKGRFRLYGADAVDRVRWIAKLQAAGFSLPELREVIRAQESSETALLAAGRLRTVYEEKLSEVQGKLAELHRIERELVASLAYLDACQSACAQHATTDHCPSCERHLDQPAPPPLVAGAFAQ